jgi:hypothetical protein
VNSFLFSGFKSSISLAIFIREWVRDKLLNANPQVISGYSIFDFFLGKFGVVTPLFSQNYSRFIGVDKMTGAIAFTED